MGIIIYGRLCRRQEVLGEPVHNGTRCRGRPSARSSAGSGIKGSWSRVGGGLGSSGHSCLADVSRCDGRSVSETGGSGGKIAGRELKRVGGASDCACKERHGGYAVESQKERIDGKMRLKKQKDTRRT